MGAVNVSTESRQLRFQRAAQSVRKRCRAQRGHSLQRVPHERPYAAPGPLLIQPQSIAASAIGAAAFLLLYFATMAHSFSR
jgi:hypothetical protein